MGKRLARYSHLGLMGLMKAVFILVLCLLSVGAHAPASAQRILQEDGTFELTPAAKRLRDELVLASNVSEELRAFYEARAYVPIWVHSPARRVAFLAALDLASDHGLPVREYKASELRRLQSESESFESFARLELAFSQSFIKYATHISAGVVAPSSVNREILHKPYIAPAADFLNGMADASSPMSFLTALEISTPEYRALLNEKRRLDALIDSDPVGTRISTRGMMRPGYKGDRVVQVRERLKVLGYGDLGLSRIYSDDLIEVVRKFQTDHKLRPDAVMGPATIGAMNKSASDRLEQVLVNLERRRWLNYSMQGRHISVNLPDFTMAVVDDGITSFRSDVVIGKTGKDYRTPEFSEDMTHMVVNPFWHVPRSIAGREFLPKLKRDPLSLSREGLLVMNRRGQVLNTAGADFSGYSERNFPFLIKQPPGNRNALGRVKFMFPNRNNIYLHDTPAKKLFRRDRRAYSHGCIRVQKPFALAYHLLEPQTKDPKGTFDYLLNRKRERQINLETPVPVHLVYHTVFLAEDGEIAYREDLYHRDRAIFDALLDAGLRLSGLSG